MIRKVVAMHRSGFIACLMVLASTASCAFDSGEEVESVGLSAEGSLPRREGAVVVDGCVLDTWQRSTLATQGAKKLIREVIMLCLVPRADGTLGPRDPSAQAALRGLADDLHREGYRVNLGVAFTDESGQRYDGAQTAALLSSASFRANVVNGLDAAAAAADGVEIDLQGLPNGARADVVELVRAFGAKVRPQKRLGVFVPPSVAEPSDLPGGDAFAVRDIAPLVDRLRVMTLDYSDREAGPTIDPGWAVDAVRFAKASAPPPAGVDVAYPLYGTDFGPRGRRSVTWLEATAVASNARARVERGPTGAPFVQWTSEAGEPHVTWFDDATSTARALGAWTPDVLPADVGVVFYGLGAEEPGLFDELAEKTP
jgi:hypothetical protein